jgi:hypothetical protein
MALNSFHYSTVLAGCYFLVQPIPSLKPIQPSNFSKPATVVAMIGGAIRNFFVGKGQTKFLIVAGYIVNMCTLIP